MIITYGILPKDFCFRNHFVQRSGQRRLRSPVNGAGGCARFSRHGPFHGTTVVPSWMEHLLIPCQTANHQLQTFLPKHQCRNNSSNIITGLTDSNRFISRLRRLRFALCDVYHLLAFYNLTAIQPSHLSSTAPTLASLAPGKFNLPRRKPKEIDTQNRNSLSTRCQECRPLTPTDVELWWPRFPSEPPDSPSQDSLARNGLWNQPSVMCVREIGEKYKGKKIILSSAGDRLLTHIGVDVVLAHPYSSKQHRYPSRDGSIGRSCKKPALVSKASLNKSTVMAYLGEPAKGSSAWCSQPF
ncbi:hypothetical protein V2G26_019723 [Clonostachys chloroleuca]